MFQLSKTIAGIYFNKPHTKLISELWDWCIMHAAWIKKIEIHIAEFEMIEDNTPCDYIRSASECECAANQLGLSNDNNCSPLWALVDHNEKTAWVRSLFQRPWWKIKIIFLILIFTSRRSQLEKWSDNFEIIVDQDHLLLVSFFETKEAPNYWA